MGWEILIPLLAKEGLPFIEAVWKKWSSGTPPTQADFDELRALSAQHAADRAKAQLVAAGVALDSQKAQDLVALTQGS